MRTLQQLLDAKSGALVQVTPEDKALDAMRKMAAYDIGAVLVLQEGKLVGILSERDCVRKLELMGRSAGATPVRELMISKVHYVMPEQTVAECMTIMTGHKFRHLPVLDANGAVVGILSERDLVKATLEEQAFTIRQLRDYITS